MQVRKNKLTVLFVFTDNTECNECLDFIMMIKAFHENGVNIKYKMATPRTNRSMPTYKENYKWAIPLPFLDKPYPEHDPMYGADFAIVQGINGNYPKMHGLRLMRTWIIFKEERFTYNKSYQKAMYYLNEDVRVYNKKAYKEILAKKIVQTFSFGYLDEVLTIKKAHRKVNMIIIDDTSIINKSETNLIRNFGNIGYEFVTTVKLRKKIYRHVRIFEKAKVLVIGKKSDSKHLVHYAMAKGVLIIRYGGGTNKHLNDNNAVLCKTVQEAYCHLIRFHNHSESYQHYINGGYQYFKLTQNAIKNAKHVIDSICSFMHL